MKARRRKEVQASEMPAVRTTIVGGRPPGSGKMLGQIPRGLEVLIKKASVDPVFKAMLLSQRSKAADAIGLVLEESEALMIDVVPEAQLQAVIAATRVDPSKKPAFLGKAAAVMLVALGAAAIGTTSAQVSRGIRPPTTTASTTSAPASQPTGGPPVDVAGITAGPRDPAAGELRPAGPGDPTVTMLGIRANPPPTTQSQPASEPTFVKGIWATKPATSSSAPASKPTSYPAVSAAEVEKLIKQLDSDTFAERDAAQKKLLDMGLGTVPLLKEKLAQGGLSLEVQTRIKNIIDKLQPTPSPTPKVMLRAVAGVMIQREEE